MPDSNAVADQAARQSQGDQAKENQGREKPSEDSQAAKIKLSTGEELTQEELEAGYMRSKDYTKKTQDLAEERRKIARGAEPEAKKTPAKKQEQEGDEEDEVKKRLSEYGVATKDDVDAAVDKRLAKMQAEQEDKSKLDSLIEANPDLKGKRKLLEQIGKTDNRAWDDIVKDPEYGLLPQGTKLEKAHQPGVMGERKVKEKSSGQPDFSKMTPKEFSEWEKTQGITGQIPLSKVEKVR